MVNRPIGNLPYDELVQDPFGMGPDTEYPESAVYIMGNMLDSYSGDGNGYGTFPGQGRGDGQHDGYGNGNGDGNCGEDPGILFSEGYIFAPYVPLLITPAKVSFSKMRVIMTRYARKILRKNFYGTIRLTPMNRSGRRTGK